MFKTEKKTAGKRSRAVLNERFVSTEQIRMIQLRVQHLMGKDTVNIMMTSADDYVKKSLLAVKLSMAMAEQGKRVLLVDMDTSKPSVHQWFGQTNMSGWAETVFDNKKAAGLIQDTIHPGLYTLTAGQNRRGSQDALLMEQVKKTAAECRGNFDLVLYLAPSYTSSADAQLVVHECDGVIVTAKTGKTKVADLLSTRKEVEKAGNKVLGVILQTGR
ncbi:CpsD/CapB family tyrosine-protein kinase [Halobacillus sp. Cin3]|uniref:CpsD/CapB family tyrosine-protein kinase n=1 Tax=Halobacillus sp. Cin3 TaxID=2928441 RepID=UPI00248F0DDD|nr:CpsD/CapB family tyrosine-protein kinase [Halobacillus sp. Cin3]